MRTDWIKVCIVFLHEKNKINYINCSFPFSVNSVFQTLTTIWCFGSRQSKLRTWTSCFRDFLNVPTHTDVCMNLSWLVSFHLGDYRSFDWQEQKHQIVFPFCASEFAEIGKSQYLTILPVVFLLKWNIIMGCIQAYCCLITLPFVDS